jgi:hypothetical protein
MSDAIRPVDAAWVHVQRGTLFLGLAGLSLCALGALVSPQHFLRAYLVAYNYWLGIALGCLVLLMLQYLTGGDWGILLRRVLEAGTRTLMLLAPLFVPLLLGLHSLYEWSQPDALAAHPELEHKHLYLNVPFFLIRAFIYFAVWLVLTYFLNRWSDEQDHAGVSEDARRLRVLSGPGLVLYGLTITFASIDWVMSLEPHWYSTIYPVMFAVGQALQGMAFALAVFLLLARRQPLAGLVHPEQLRDLGNLLLTFVMVWGYMSFSQFLLIWVGNLPEEIPWYLRRTRGGWEWVALLLIIFQLGLPFFLLLSRSVKQTPHRLARVALLVLAFRFLDLVWWIEPAFLEGVSFYWVLDLAALVGIGGIWVSWFVRELGRRPLLPLHTPLLTEYLAEAPHE